MSLHIFHDWHWLKEYATTEFTDPRDSLSPTYKQFYHRFVCHCGAIKSVREKS